MSLVKALTDTKAGGAQVFDTSGIATAYQQQEAIENAKAEKLMAESMQYDPGGLYQDDIPIYKDAMDDYYKWIGEHSEQLMNPGENIDIWNERKRRENDIKNYVVGSKQKNTYANQASNMVFGDEKYFSQENIDYLSGIGATSMEDSRKGLFDGKNIVGGLDRLLTNIKTPDQYASLVEKHIAEAISTTSPGTVVDNGVLRGIMLGTEEGYKYDMDKVKESLSTLFDNGSPESRDLNYKYRDSEDKLQDFVDDVMAWARTKGASSSDFRSGGTGGGKAPKGYYAAVPSIGSSQDLVEAGSGMGYTKEERRKAKRTGKTLVESGSTYAAGIATVNKVMSEGEDKSKAGTEKGLVMRVDGMKLKIKTDMHDATNTTTGKPLSDDQAQMYQSADIVEFGNYWWAREDIIIPIIDANGATIDKITVEKGSPLPDIDYMLEKKMISQKRHDDILNRDYGLVRPGTGMVVSADPEPVNIFGMVKGGEYTETKGASEGGKIWAVLPVEGRESAINSAIGDLYPDLAEEHNGDALGGILKSMELDNAYYDFWMPSVGPSAFGE